MTGYVRTCDGRRLTLPALLQWSVRLTDGDPCDSFSVRFLYEAELSEALRKAVLFEAEELGRMVFTGVVDDYEIRMDKKGLLVEMTGRGLAALLLDNQAEAADYGQATLAEILRRYVTPYGVGLEKAVSLPAVQGFSVASGSSCWKVLYTFARYYAGVTPRFTRAGKLALHPWEDKTPAALDETAPVTRVVRRDQRYGVLSQVTVKDVTGWTRQTEFNEDFRRRGGQCSRVILLPKDTGFQARRYQAKFQLDRSAAERLVIEVTVALPFAAWPGDLVRLTRTGWSGNGTYRVRESRVCLGELGHETTLVLGDPQGVL